MRDLVFRPIDVWPGALTEPSERRSHHTFSAEFRTTLRQLNDELRRLEAVNPVLQLAVHEGQIYVDGRDLKAHVVPTHPGVILSFDSVHGPLKYWTDTFDDIYRNTNLGWKANVRAITLGLEALRKLERYGITRRGEQYTGWKALGSGIAMGPAPMSVAEALAVIANLAGGPGHADWRSAYRRAAERWHPDKPHGDEEEFKRLAEAKRIIEESEA